MQDIYFSITTPKREGGIGVIELYGRDLRKIISPVFRLLKSGKPASLESNHLYLGNIISPAGKKIDEVIINYQPAQFSPVKLDTVEINAHGGVMSCRLIGNLLRKKCVKEISYKEIIDLAYKKGALDIIQKEALEHLIDAPTSLAVAVLLDQYNGALARALKQKSNLPQLIESARLGLALTHPKRILIAGSPNTGKSTLFNTILDKDRAITHHIAGTTRDTIEEIVAISDFPFILVDSAGLRRVKAKSAQSRIEKTGIRYARKEIARADLILLVIEPGPVKGKNKTLITPELAEHKKKLIVVLNKTDKISASRLAKITSSLALPLIPISALKKQGIDRLQDAILNALGLKDLKHTESMPVIFTPRQLSEVKK